MKLTPKSQFLNVYNTKLIWNNQDCDVPEEEWRALSSKYQEAVSAFQHMNELIQSRVLFNQSMVDEYQRAADKFYFCWVELNGREGITNYVHTIVCHMGFFLFRYGSLYKFSQQGWEHHNKRLLGVYHRHTQKGGNGAKAGDKSHILPLHKHEARCWMWKTAKGDQYFQEKDQKRRKQ